MERTRIGKRMVIRFGVLEATYWCIMAAYNAYMTSFALARGYAQSIVSIMVAINMICAFSGQFFWGSICDKFRMNRRFFMIGVSCAGVVQLIIYAVDHIVVFGVLYGLFGFLIGPMGTLLETWMLKSIRYDMKAFGIARGSGSAGYAVLTLVTGNLIRKFGYGVMPILSSVFLVVTLMIAITTENPQMQDGLGEKKPISIKDIFSILKMPSYVLILVVVLLVGMANAPVVNLKIVLLENVGGDVGTLGLDSFAGCMLQFLIFLMAGFLVRVPARVRLLIATIAMMASMGMNFLATAPWMIIVGSLLQNVQFGFLVPAVREIVMHEVDPKFQASANGLTDAFYGSMSGTISMLYAGVLVQNFGPTFMVGVSLVISIIPVVVLLVQRVVNRRKQ